jgi:hypothetical protein
MNFEEKIHAFFSQFQFGEQHDIVELRFTIATSQGSSPKEHTKIPILYQIESGTMEPACTIP